MNIVETYEAVDDALVHAGWHATTAWWRAELDRYLTSPCLRWVVRAGRRAGKSSTMCRLAAARALESSWRASITPGDRGVIAFVSVNRAEASQRLYTIAAILRVLGVPFDERGDELELRDLPVVFRVATCSISGTVGFTSLAVFADELARWEAGENYSNPASEVLGSLRPTLAGVVGALEVCVSSPWGLTDEHAKLFDAGDVDEEQVVSQAPTWIARPQLTEAATHKLEKDPIKWQREYAAIPGSLESSAFANEDVLAAFARDAEPGVDAERIICIDASRGRTDDFAWSVITTGADGLPIVVEVGGVSPPATQDIAIEALVVVAKRHNVRRVFGDHYDAPGIQRELMRAGVAYNAHAWSQSSKSEAGALLRRLITDRQLSICEHARLKSELLTQRSKLRPSTEQVVYETNGRDYISTLFAFCDAVVRGEVSIEIRSNAPTAAALEALEALPPIADASDDSTMDRVAHEVDAESQVRLAELRAKAEAMGAAMRERMLAPAMRRGEPVLCDFVNDPVGAADALRGFAADNR